MSGASLFSVKLERDFQRLTAAELGDLELLAAAADRIAHAIPYDGCCVSSVDPGTLVLTHTWTAGIPADEFATAFYASEHGPADYATHQDLVAGRYHAAVLGALTKGQPARSARYRRLLAPMGVRYELRAAALAGAAPWAFIHLYRRPGRRDFDADELAAVRRVAPGLALARRAAVVRGSEQTRPIRQQQASSAPPATILVDTRMAIVGMAGPAREWLAAMCDPLRPEQALPVSVMSIVQGTLLGATPQHVRVLAPSGGWWLLSAAPLEDAVHKDTVAVTAEPARGAVLTDVLMLALGLTPGERDVCELVLTGASTKLIARTLYLSPYTVQDRLKAIYVKADVGSRGELVARLNR